MTLSFVIPEFNIGRGVSLIDAVGLQLGITPEQMTRFFETNDYKELLPEEQITGLEIGRAHV